MKILILTTKFPIFGNRSYLTSELADELVEQGHEVTVRGVAWDKKETGGCLRESSLDVLMCNSLEMSILGRGRFFFKWAFSGFKLFPFLLKSIFLNKRYDRLIVFSPCSALGLSLILANWISKKSVLIYWDFFPIHNYRIGMPIPARLLGILRKYEAFLIARFSCVGLMSDACVDYYDKYFYLANVRRKVIPLWTSRLVIDKSIEESNDDKVIYVFGGQLSKGRGVEALLQAFDIASRQRSDLRLIICGSGILSSFVEDYVHKNPEVFQYMGEISRDNYWRVLAFADVGFVITVDEVESPSYPSKSLDYMAAGLAIIASVEPASDFGDIVCRNKMGFSVLQGDNNALVDGIIEMRDSASFRKEAGNNAMSFLKKTHDVKNVVKGILE